jgi:hypothetical protein
MKETVLKVLLGVFLAATIWSAGMTIFSFGKDVGRYESDQKVDACKCECRRKR